MSAFSPKKFLPIIGQQWEHARIGGKVVLPALFTDERKQFLRNTRWKHVARLGDASVLKFMKILIVAEISYARKRGLEDVDDADRPQTCPPRFPSFGVRPFPSPRHPANDSNRLISAINGDAIPSTLRVPRDR